jgi:hypothetical protein
MMHHDSWMMVRLSVEDKEESQMSAVSVHLFEFPGVTDCHQFVCSHGDGMADGSLPCTLILPSKLFPMNITHTGVFCSCPLMQCQDNVRQPPAGSYLPLHVLGRMSLSVC